MTAILKKEGAPLDEPTGEHVGATTDRAPAYQPVLNRRRAAIVAGIGYVALFALAVFANFIVREDMVIADDAQATAINIADSTGLFRLGLASFVVIFLLDIVVAWALHMVFRVVHSDLSLAAAWSRLVYTVFLGVASIFMFEALSYYESPAVAEALGPAERNAHALVGLEMFNSTWMIGLAAFGLHLIVLGYLVVKSAEAPRLLGYFMVIAGAVYLVDTMAHSMLSNYNEYSSAFLMMVAIPSVVAEGWLGLWLLFYAGKAGVSG